MRLESVGTFKFIAANDTYLENPGMILFDTNIVIKLSQLFYNGSTNNDLRLDLSRVLEQFPMHLKKSNFIETNYGWGILEACTNRKGDFNPKRWDELNFAMEELRLWDKENINKRFKTHHPLSKYSKRFKKNYNRIIPSNDYPPENLNPFVLAGYIYSLKLFSLYEQSDLLPEQKFKEFIDWMTDTTKVRSAYFIHLATSLFLSNNQSKIGEVKKIFKYTGKTSENPDKFADRCWNGAWDIFFTSMCEMGTSGLVPISKEVKYPNTVLLTQNKDPEQLRRKIELFKILKISSSVSTILLDVEQQMDDRFINMGLHEYRSLTLEESIGRLNISPIELEKSLLNEKQKLEDLLNIK